MPCYGQFLSHRSSRKIDKSAAAVAIGHSVQGKKASWNPLKHRLKVVIIKNSTAKLPGPRMSKQDEKLSTIVSKIVSNGAGCL
jgi:hypothetical protein